MVKCSVPGDNPPPQYISIDFMFLRAWKGGERDRETDVRETHPLVASHGHPDQSWGGDWDPDSTLVQEQNL